MDGLGAATSFVHTDVSDADSVQAAIDHAQQQFGALHVMVNNAGISGSSRRLMQDDLRDFDRVIAVDLYGVMVGIIALAAHLLGEKRRSGQDGDGNVTAGSKTISFNEVVLAAYTARSIPAGFEPGMEATHFFEPSNFTFPFGAHVVSVEVDAETGEINVDKYVAVDDCGNVINPMIVDGQITGGIAQGLGQALYEEHVTTRTASSSPAR